MNDKTVNLLLLVEFLNALLQLICRNAKRIYIVMKINAQGESQLTLGIDVALHFKALSNADYSQTRPLPRDTV